MTKTSLPFIKLLWRDFQSVKWTKEASLLKKIFLWLALMLRLCSFRLNIWSVLWALPNIYFEVTFFTSKCRFRSGVKMSTANQANVAAERENSLQCLQRRSRNIMSNTVALILKDKNVIQFYNLKNISSCIFIQFLNVALSLKPVRYLNLKIFVYVFSIFTACELYFFI